MPHPRRKFDPEFRAGAVWTVTETGRPVAHVARELGVDEGTLGNWVRRGQAEQEGGLTADERAELSRLRKRITIALILPNGDPVPTPFLLEWDADAQGRLHMLIAGGRLSGETLTAWSTHVLVDPESDVVVVEPIPDLLAPERQDSPDFFHIDEQTEAAAVLVSDLDAVSAYVYRLGGSDG